MDRNIRAVIFDMYETLVTQFESPLYYGTQIARDLGVSAEIFLPDWRKTEEDRAIGKQTFEAVMEQLMVLSDYYLCFLSEANYLSYRNRSADFFVSLVPYADSAEVTYYEGRTDAVYLHSTVFGSLPGFAELPEDTLICLRGVSEVARRANRKGSEKNFKSAEKTLRNIFTMQEK